jgi:hydroxyethylthiazole kinase-like uncharacterized protein yjeF
MNPTEHLIERMQKRNRVNLALYSAAQMRQAEKLIRDTGIHEIEMIEKAGRGIAEFVANRFERRPVAVLCGSGANGSDGFLAAAILERAGWNVHVYCIKQTIMLDGIAAEAAKMYKGDVSVLSEIVLNEDYIVIDAIFGRGLNRKLSLEINETFNAVRQENVTVIAVDVPTGLGKDMRVDENILKADYTVTFARPRIEHVLQPGAQYCGKIHVVDIGIDQSCFAGMEVPAHLNSPELWNQFWKVPDASTHKYIRGHVAVLGGEDLIGAARLAVSGAMRTGAGVGSIVTTKGAAKIYQSTVAPEVMVRGFDNAQDAADLMHERHVSVCLIGPGADDALGMQALADACLKHDMQIVLDGDALGAVSLNGASVITPHDGEFARMFPELATLPNKLDRAKKAAAKAGCVVVLKGMDTIIASPDGRACVNTVASPWLSTAGSGDVLAGAIAGCLAQKIPPFEAACGAVWMHGAASMKLSAGMVASELPIAMARTLTEIYKTNYKPKPTK